MLRVSWARTSGRGSRNVPCSKALQYLQHHEVDGGAPSGPSPCSQCGNTTAGSMHTRAARLQRGELVEVRGEERGAANLAHEVLRDRPRQAKAIVRAGAAPQLVNDHQAARACALRQSPRVITARSMRRRNCTPGESTAYARYRCATALPRVCADNGGRPQHLSHDGGNAAQQA